MLFWESFSQLELCGLRFENLDIFQGLWPWIILLYNGHFSLSLGRHHHGFRVGPLSITILCLGFFECTAWPLSAFFWQPLVQNDFQRDLIVWRLFFLVHWLVSGYFSRFPRSPFRLQSLLAFWISSELIPFWLRLLGWNLVWKIKFELCFCLKETESQYSRIFKFWKLLMQMYYKDGRSKWPYGWADSLPAHRMRCLCGHQLDLALIKLLIAQTYSKFLFLRPFLLDFWNSKQLQETGSSVRILQSDFWGSICGIWNSKRNQLDGVGFVLWESRVGRVGWVDDQHGT